MRLTPNAEGCEDLDPLVPRLVSARVIALGELIHDAHELQLLRNRFARCLVQSGQITAIALESGLADMIPLHEALLRPPRSVWALTRERISYGWGGLPEVQALTEWVRGHNASQPLDRRIRLYGIDITGADGSGSFNRARRSIDELIKYLMRLNLPEARGLSSKLKPYRHRFSEAAYASLSPRARDSLRGVLDSVEIAVQSLPDRPGDKQSHDRAWAARCVAAVRQVMNFLELKQSLGKQPARSPELPRLIQMRDSIMADNLLWALGQQPGGGRILVFAHNAHVFVDPGPTTLGPPLVYATLGHYLRRAMDSAYMVIGTDARALGYYLPEQDPAPAPHLASMFGMLGQSWLMIDLRAAAQDSVLGAWLRQPRRVRFQWGFQWIHPALAADFLIIADSLSPTGGEIR